jgi:hypothetical protein
LGYFCNFHKIVAKRKLLLKWRNFAQSGHPVKSRSSLKRAYFFQKYQFLDFLDYFLDFLALYFFKNIFLDFFGFFWIFWGDLLALYFIQKH